jgi:hypothetical protein
MNAMSCLEYAVEALKVRTIIVTGHYGCGAVKAALQLPHASRGLVNSWISDIRECRNQHEAELRALPDDDARVQRLVELNVVRQVFHVATSPVVARAWAAGQPLTVYGLVYALKDGLLRRVAGPVSSADVEDCASDVRTFAALCGKAGSEAAKAAVAAATDKAGVMGAGAVAVTAVAGGNGKAPSSPRPPLPPAAARGMASAPGSPRRAVLLEAMAAMAAAGGGSGGGGSARHLKAEGEGEGGEGAKGGSLVKRSMSSSALESLNAALTNVSLKDAIHRHGAWAAA